MTKSELKIPRNLKHKPVIFEKVSDDSDAKFFSIGKAQWDNNDFSIKVFRYPGFKLLMHNLSGI